MRVSYFGNREQQGKSTGLVCELLRENEVFIFLSESEVIKDRLKARVEI